MACLQKVLEGKAVARIPVEVRGRRGSAVGRLRKAAERITGFGSSSEKAAAEKAAAEKAAAEKAAAEAHAL